FITVSEPPIADPHDGWCGGCRRETCGYPIKRFSEQQNKKVKGFTKDAAQMIESYSWPGNIRELENKVKRAVIMADGLQITAEDLELGKMEEESPLPLNLKEVREIAETSAIKRALGFSDNNISKTAKLLGVSRPTLYTLFNKYGIQISDEL
ncbi:MAG: AAA family ATPase, partial [gamma proteobacterium symbiont of Lucinoma myriamae]|nr:AAA family ATPase [gamma proteobacterium symbiont of Lucinoma myriamae]MCU7818612.1 AAA family ATPase [gamma proteobacterium symbiont of Lucinoma myriamae]MCU7832650.1 AAA family ATPase [gamma proteobacterium symbiont of Lucinoma myriamae]